jgi:hypothetical protein
MRTKDQRETLPLDALEEVVGRGSIRPKLVMKMVQTSWCSRQIEHRPIIIFPARFRIAGSELHFSIFAFVYSEIARSRRLLPPPKLPLQTLKSQIPNQSRSPKLRSANQKSGQQRVYPNGQDWKIEVPILFPKMWLRSGDLTFSFIYFLMGV